MTSVQFTTMWIKKVPLRFAVYSGIVVSVKLSRVIKGKVSSRRISRERYCYSCSGKV
jgi:hypothetical protein